jgi:hypothetical protein
MKSNKTYGRFFRHRRNKYERYVQGVAKKKEPPFTETKIDK